MDTSRRSILMLVVILGAVLALALWLGSTSGHGEGWSLDAPFSLNTGGAYDASHVGLPVAYAGQIVGAGTDQWGRYYVDIADQEALSTGHKGVRCIQPREKRGVTVIIVGTLRKPGQINVYSKTYMLPP